MEKRVVCAVVVLLLVLSCGSASAQSAAELLNIDCGAKAGYVDAGTGLQWVTDAAYIPTGTNHEGFLAPTDYSYASLTELNSLRAFGDRRTKNCYRLPVAMNATYLLRASFFYGNYDNTAKPPSFQLALEATVVENVTTSTTGVVYKEILYLSQSNATYFCLLRDSTNSTPFVSSITLRPITAVYDRFNLYLGQFRYMTIRTRINFGGSALVRFPDDPYDRYWHPEGSKSPYLSPTASPVQALGVATPITSESFRPPSKVMQTAVTTTGNLTSYYLQPGSVISYSAGFIILHFAELDPAVTATSREFLIDLGMGGTPTPMNPFNSSEGAFKRTTWLFWDREVQPSTLLSLFPASPLTIYGPILNAMEVYSVSDARRVNTRDSDVVAIEAIKADMNLSEWTGDPCLPSPYPWVQCNVVDLVLIPPEVTAINLTGYNLMGPVSRSFANLLSLTSLSLGHNALIGPLPNLSSLVLMKTLNLENNNFSGSIPDWLTSLPLLSVLSLQNNNFSGPIPVGLLTSSNLHITICPGNNFFGVECEKTATSESKSKSKSSNLAAIVGASVGGVVVSLLIVIVGVYIGCRRCRRQNRSAQQNGTAGGRAVARKEIGTVDGASRAFTLATLAVATNNFKKEIGKGGFGPVYHGTLPDGREVAVKVADNTTRQGDQEFYNEVSHLSKLHHRNLTTLIGYCQEKKKQILVYEYVRNGSLFDHLHGESKPARPLDWRTRLSIAVNAAQGLDYLHSNCNPSIIHRDVKSGNILLTGPGHAEVAKVADFGLSKAGPVQDETHVSTEVRGTAGYLDPQYFDTQKLTLKSDVFSFGVVLLELITGRRPVDATHAVRGEWNLCQYVRKVLGSGEDVNIEEILDPAVLASHPNLNAVWMVAEVALRSVEPRATHRPTMAEVLQELRVAFALEHQAQAPPTQAPHPPTTVQPDASIVFYESDAMPEPR